MAIEHSKNKDLHDARVKLEAKSICFLKLLNLLINATKWDR